MVPCPACGCHAKSHEIACPHCGESLRRADGTIPRTAAAILLGLTAVAGVDCGSGGGPNGMGGMGGAYGATSTHYGFGPTYMATSSSGMGADPCATGSDCSQCADFQTCASCEEKNNPQGAQLFDALLDCLYCTACYTVCDGASSGCQMAPATMDACDDDAPDPYGPGCDGQMTNPPTGCIPCAEAATCKDPLDACKNSPDCVALNTALQACPTN